MDRPVNRPVGNGIGRCAEIDTSRGREAICSLLHDQCAPCTDARLMAQPLSEKAGMLRGLRHHPGTK
jgi:hypothetical protein